MNDRTTPAALTPELIARLCRHRRPASTRSPIPTCSCPICANGATCTRAAPPSCCGPARTEEVSKILALAHEHGLPVVPQAGNTGLVGGQTPMRGEILLSVARLERVRALDPAATP